VQAARAQRLGPGTPADDSPQPDRSRREAEAKTPTAKAFESSSRLTRLELVSGPALCRKRSSLCTGLRLTQGFSVLLPTTRIANVAHIPDSRTDEQLDRQETRQFAKTGRSKRAVMSADRARRPLRGGQASTHVLASGFNRYVYTTCIHTESSSARPNSQ
jgi:hypothetical protein